ncbi:TIGR03885 family FMN-dependent LLM class oxidoreductase [Ketogulonicigenium vulgare]|uniref:TIGR03885 family FMN-dependent LLM class oxidoreductase n=1 Tax=Ketogulonicigenium vulgare TaxID=92945 RepID=UPI002358B646|nr:TIGR03885 family FMN-dependent LLM class oxidoreductase [Ketogulonicigenium vulgare]
MKIGYHASQEQFPPEELLQCAVAAEQAGFDGVKTSEHFHPWSANQGHSGYSWSWITAAMQISSIPFGLITAPGYRHHPASVAQAAATVARMYPDRFWLALGSGEAINEAITGVYWPEKAERNAKLKECAAIIRALLTGNEVTFRGRVTVIEAQLFTLPTTPVPIYGAAISCESAAQVAQWADGLLTVGGDPRDVSEIVKVFRESGGAGKPIHIQHALSWAPDDALALHEARHQWAPVIAGGEVNCDIRRPKDFDRFATFVDEPALRAHISISADLGVHAAQIAALGEIGDYIHLHGIGRNQRQFIETFGATVLPQLR